MNWVNGVRVGGVRIGSSPYAAGRRHFRRMIYLFLKYVVGWTEVSKTGSNWDNAAVAGAADGATHATDRKIFTSATGGFSAIDPQSDTNRYYLIVTGFTNAEHNGMYLIQQVVDDNTLYINKAYCGVHHTGFQELGKGSLTWRIDDLKSDTLVPAIGDEFYVRGVGIGGNFQLHCLSDNAVTWSQDKFRVSPDDGTNWTAYTAGETEPYHDSGLVFGCADLTHAVFWVRYFQYDMSSGSQYPSFHYFGDITAFRPTDDTKPVVCMVGRTNSDWAPWGWATAEVIRSLSDTNIQILERIIYPTVHGSSGTEVMDNTRKTHSEYSGRLIRAPLVVANSNNTYAEIRGKLKSVELFHRYGVAAVSPFGTGRDRLKLYRASIPWNGSKQYWYVF